MPGVVLLGVCWSQNDVPRQSGSSRNRAAVLLEPIGRAASTWLQQTGRPRAGYRSDASVRSVSQYRTGSLAALEHSEWHAHSVPRLAAIDVPPSPDGVSILDATWQDHPAWESDNDRIAFKAASLTNPESPPYPGFAVRTAAECAQGSASTIRVELWGSTRPDGLELLHSSVLSVGRAGVELGNADNSLVTACVPAGDWEIEAWVDAREASAVCRVAFVLPGLTS